MSSPIIMPGQIETDGLEHIINLPKDLVKAWNNGQGSVVREAMCKISNVLGCIYRHDIKGQFRVMLYGNLKPDAHQKTLRQIIEKLIELRVYNGNVQDALPRPMIKK